MKKSIFVEIVRLLIVLAFTAAGYGVAVRYGWALYGTVLGAATGYVCGGIFGRQLGRTMGAVEAHAADYSAGEFLTGVVGALLVGGLGGLIGVAAVGLLPGDWGWLVLALTVWTGANVGFRIAWKKSSDMLSLAGLSDRASHASLAAQSQDSILVDTNILVDGHRLVRVARTGFLQRNLIIPTFVLDELQGLADSNEPETRKAGRLGLESLDALRRDPLMNVQVTEDQIPEIETVDAKLIALALRLSVNLLTNDEPLTRVAELRGVHCLSMTRLASSVSPVRAAGEIVEVKITKHGEHEGEGIAYLEDGSMVVIANASEKVGFDVDVRIISSTVSSRGRIYFAALAEY